MAKSEWAICLSGIRKYLYPGASAPGVLGNSTPARRIGLILALLSDQTTQVGNAVAEKVEHINLELIPNYGERLMIDEQNFKELR